MFYKNIKAFTLLELLVVITILAILSTVGFMSYTSYLIGVRDTNRISQLKSMSDGLITYSIKHILPYPDDYIEIKNGTKIIGYQGYIGKSVLNKIGYSSDGYDPKDKEYFSYYITKNRKGYELMGLLEEEYLGLSSNDNVLETNRYPYTVGQKLGILTNTLNIPVQAISSLITTKELNIGNVGTDGYNSYLKYNEVVTGTGTTFSTLAQIASDKGKGWSVENNNFVYSYSNSSSSLVKKTVSDCGTLSGQVIYGTKDGTDVGLVCNDNIIVCNGTTGSGITISACNALATTVYVDQTFTSSTAVRDDNINSWAGGLYQWGNNENISNTATSSTLPDVSVINSQYNGNGYFIFGSDNWNSVTNDEIWGNSSSNLVDKKGPCLDGYHVPTNSEWGLINTIGGWDNGLDMSNDLKMPIAGYRNRNTGGMSSQGASGYYWSTTKSSNTSAYRLYLTSSSIDPHKHTGRARGSSVRCFKD